MHVPSDASGSATDGALRDPMLLPGAAFFAPDAAATDGAISGASRRLRALASLSGSLTDALSPGDAAGLVQEQALSALGATSAVVVTLGSFPAGNGDGDHSAPAEPVLSLVHAIGVEAELQASLERLPLAAPGPLTEVARTGAPLFLPDELALRRYPSWGDAVLRGGARAAAVVPVWANGELRGVLALTWPAPRTFDEDERAFVLTLGVMCAQAIMRAYLRAAEIEAREAAEEANRSKTQFLTMISHELRTPMNAVIGYTELLADEISGPVSELQKEQLGRVRASGKHLMGLIEELLGYARVESGKDDVFIEPVLLADLVAESILVIYPLAEQKGLRIRVEGPATPIELQTDGRKLRQVIVNLLANAVKFTTVGDVVVHLRVEGLETDVRVYIEVTDTGRGIAARDFENVFEAFWRAEDGHAYETEGTGLGLPVARKLARRLGGDVRIERSEPGVGSTFVVSLPATLGSPAAIDSAH